MTGRTFNKIVSDGGLDATKIMLLTARTGSPGDRLRINIRQSQSARINNVWWLSDRPIEVRSLQLDARQIAALGKEMSLVLFMGMSKPSDSEIEPGFWQLKTARWLVTGQGIMLFWY